MTNTKQNQARARGMAERAKILMETNFPDVAVPQIWDRKKFAGFSTIPRTMPIAMQVVDALSPKGQPAGHVLLCLWMRAPDHSFMSIDNPAAFAAEAGFSGVRAVDTWRRRMRTLSELEFIKAKQGASGEFQYVLLKNPNMAIEMARSRLQEALYSRFVERVLDIGAHSELEQIRHFLTAEPNAALIK